ncbi:hypothetical protein LCGC14_0364980 [marine sediment metagenome]|uniref:Uncharacterized protein n=1 Tax=marine sediment metagenome TaxID=412755 RepID=A0A0F9VU65_9ZZZZ
MKYIILFLISLSFAQVPSITHAFAQVPDSVIVNKIAGLKVIYSDNERIMAVNMEQREVNIAKQNKLLGKIEALEELLKEEEPIEEDD